jgi:hypothetical protein
MKRIKVFLVFPLFFTKAFGQSSLSTYSITNTRMITKFNNGSVYPNYVKTTAGHNFNFANTYALYAAPKYATRGRTLWESTVWGGLTGLVLGASAGFKFNEDAPDGKTKLRNVLFLSTLGVAVGITIGFIVGSVKAIKQKKEPTSKNGD